MPGQDWDYKQEPMPGIFYMGSRVGIGSHAYKANTLLTGLFSPGPEPHFKKRNQ